MTGWILPYYKHTVEETLHHLGCISPWDKLPTSTGELRISEPLTVNSMKFYHGLPRVARSESLTTPFRSYAMTKCTTVLLMASQPTPHPPRNKALLKAY